MPEKIHRVTAMPSGLSPLTQLATEPLDAKTESLIKSILSFKWFYETWSSLAITKQLTE